MIKKMYDKSIPIQLVSLTNELRKEGTLEDVGGAYYISGLVTSVSSGEDNEYHALQIKQCYLLRELIRISSEVNNKSFENGADPFVIIAEIEEELANISKCLDDSGSKTVTEILTEVYAEIDEAINSGHRYRGITTDFRDIDETLHGLMKSDLIMLAGRPAMGKSALAMCIAKNISANHHVYFVSLEMSAVQLMNRLLANETKIALTKIINGHLTDKEVQKIQNVQGLINSKLYIDDTPSINTSHLRAKCKRMKARRGLDLLIIDYLQLVRLSDKTDRKVASRENEVSEISRQLKRLAKELNIPVLCLSQLSRAVEARNNKRPMLSDLKESGDIEANADSVMFVYRPEVYGFPEMSDGSPSDGMAEVIVSKNRHGGLKNIPLFFEKNLVKFTDIELSEKNVENNFDFEFGI